MKKINLTPKHNHEIKTLEEKTKYQTKRDRISKKVLNYYQLRV